MSISDSLQVRSLTLRYVPTEDRLAVQLTLADTSLRKLWVTRHLCRSLIDALGDLLDKSYQEVPLIGSEQKIDKTLGLQFEQQEATDIKTQAASQAAAQAAQSAPATPTPAPEPEPRDDGLCTSIDVAKIGDFKWRLSWKASQGPAYPMNLTRIEMHQLLQSLAKQQIQSKWDISIQYPWIHV